MANFKKRTVGHNLLCGRKTADTFGHRLSGRNLFVLTKDDKYKNNGHVVYVSSLEEVENIYMYAWKNRCKGITVYREGSRDGILITEDANKAAQQAKEKSEQEKSSSITRDEGMPTTHPNLTSSPHPSILPEVKPVKRPQMLQGFTEVIKTGYGNLYVTVNTYDDKPFEVFVQIGKSGYTTMADAEATGRLVSLALRSGINVKDVVEQLEGI